MPNRWICLFDAETILKALLAQMQAESKFMTSAEATLHNARVYVTRQMVEVE